MQNSLQDRIIFLVGEIEHILGEAQSSEAFIQAVNDPLLGPMMFLDPGYVGNAYMSTKPLLQPIRECLDKVIALRDETLAAENVDDFRGDISIMCCIIKQLELQVLRLTTTLKDIKELMNSLAGEEVSKVEKSA
jgi:hypothetical protein